MHCATKFANLQRAQRGSHPAIIFFYFYFINLLVDAHIWDIDVEIQIGDSLVPTDEACSTKHTRSGSGGAIQL